MRKEPKICRAACRVSSVPVSCLSFRNPDVRIYAPVLRQQDDPCADGLSLRRLKPVSLYILFRLRPMLPSVPWFPDV